jgi:hypothetical protein
MKATPLLPTPDRLTTTFPVVAPEGTVVTIEVAFQIVGVAGVPLNVTVPGVAKFVPVIVTVALTGPEFTESFVMLGIGSTVNATSLLPTEPIQTFAFRLPGGAVDGTFATIVVAFQLMIGATIPPNFTLFVPWVPNPVPLMVTAVPTGPDVGDRLVIVAPPDGVFNAAKLDCAAVV